MAVNNMVHSATEFGKVVEDIANAGKNKRKDNFTVKCAFVCCNEIYADKAGLGNLPAVLNDIKTIRRTLRMMGISEENIVELIDASHAKMVEAEEKLMDMIKAGSVKLSGPTGIGPIKKFSGGIQWKILRDIVFKLVDVGKIKVNVDEEGAKRVDLTELNEIKVGLSCFYFSSSNFFHSFNWIRRIRRHCKSS